MKFVLKRVLSIMLVLNDSMHVLLRLMKLDDVKSTELRLQLIHLIMTTMNHVTQEFEVPENVRNMKIEDIDGNSGNDTCQIITSGVAPTAPDAALSRDLISLETASTAISRALVPRLALSSALLTVFNRELIRSIRQHQCLLCSINIPELKFFFKMSNLKF